MIDPAMVTTMRATVRSTLGPATAQLVARTPHRTPTGGTTYTWANAGAAVPATVAKLSAAEMEWAGRMGISAQITCRVPWDLDVDEQDRVTIAGTGADELDGTWEVTQVLVSSPVLDRYCYLSRVP